LMLSCFTSSISFLAFSTISSIVSSIFVFFSSLVFSFKELQCSVVTNSSILLRDCCILRPSSSIISLLLDGAIHYSSK
jgi:hypothetical protein